MSTNKLSQKILSALFLVVFFSLLISLFRQILVYRHISKRLTEEQKELQNLEERNKELKKRLEAIKTSDLLDNEIKATLDLGNTLTLPLTQELSSLTEPRMPNYEKWWRLFFY